MTIIDRRRNPSGKSLVNRNKFLRRTKEQIKEAVKKSIENTDIKDIAGSHSISIPNKGIKEYHIVNGDGGNHKRIYPGNKEYIEGDEIPKPERGGGGKRGRKASDSGEGEDDFEFTLSKDEFLDVFFEDLELPDMIKKQLKSVTSFEHKRGGYTTTGSPNNLNIRQTMRHALGRRIALSRPKSDEIKELEEELFKLEKKIKRTKQEQERFAFVQEELKKLRHRMKAIPFVDPVDVRYNIHIKTPLPTTQAVMFCLMDVSGSMGEREKDLSKRFFMLLYLFLQRQYDKIDVVFIRHTTEAQEVDEETFFYSKETGGTKVSSSLELLEEIIRKRYPIEDWNIYVSQCSDGDNFGSDSAYCEKLLNEKILSQIQYYAYVEIGRDGNSYNSTEGDLWKHYKAVSDKSEKFQITKIGKVSDIFPVFRKLFEKSK